jgi:hypothetical protein
MRKIKWIATVGFILALVFGSVSTALAADDSPQQDGQRPPALRGEVLQINGHNLTVQTRREEVHVVTSNDTVFRIPDVEEPSISDIAVGDTVVILGRRTGETFHARLVGVVSPDDRPAQTGGQVVAIEGADITVNNREGETVVIRTDAETTFRIPGVEEAGIDDVQVDQIVIAAGVWNDDGTFDAAVVGVPREAERRGRLLGEVVSVEGDTLTVRNRDDAEFTLLTDEETTIHILGMEDPTLSDLNEGDPVAIGVEMRDGTLYARTIGVVPEEAARVSGQVDRVEGATLVLETRYGSLQVHTGAETLFRIPGLEEASLDDIIAGDRVTCSGEWEGADTFRALLVAVPAGEPGEGRPAGVRGRVTSVGSDHLTLGTQQGPVTVLVDQETTIRVPDIEEPTLSDIGVGDPVGVRGVWDAEGAIHAEGLAVLQGSPDGAHGPSRQSKLPPFQPQPKSH